MFAVLCDMAPSLATSSIARLSRWFQTPTGRRLLSEQSPLVRECARRFHGDSLLWVGCHTDLAETVRGCMVRNRFFLSLPGVSGPMSARVDTHPTRTEAQAEGASPADPALDLAEFQSSLEEIPLPNGSLDAVVLHHVLEAAADPRTAIRELSRVLAPGGRLVICTFNPFSLWGIRGIWARFREDGFSDLRFVNPIRLLDWLAVLGFELQHEVKYMAYGLPFPTGDRDPALWKRIRARLADYRIPFGGVYLISAVKQAAAARPSHNLDPARGRALAPAAYPKISALLRTPPEESETP